MEWLHKYFLIHGGCVIRLVEYWNRRREPTWLLGFVSFLPSPPSITPPFPFPPSHPLLLPPPHHAHPTHSVHSIPVQPTHSPPPSPLTDNKAAAHDMGFSYLIPMRGCKGIGVGDVLGRWDMCWIYGGRRGLIHEVGEGGPRGGKGKTRR